jgi:hypothetical protein
MKSGRTESVNVRVAPAVLALLEQDAARLNELPGRTAYRILLAHYGLTLPLKRTRESGSEAVKRSKLKRVMRMKG